MAHGAFWPGDAAQPLLAGLPGFRRCHTPWGQWSLALVIWTAALALRWLLDNIADSGPFLTFLPAIALATLFCGRWPAIAMIALSAVVADYYWIPPQGFEILWPTTPASLALFVGIAVFELVMVDSLYQASCDNSERQSRRESSLRLRETLSQEMRHRVRDQLHVIAAVLEGSQIKLDRGASAEDVLEQAIGRISSITHLQQIMDDAAGDEREFVPLLRDVLDHVFYDVDVVVQVRATSVEVPPDQMTIVCLIVIEAAMNALKHIFRRRRGHMFAVELRAQPNATSVLTIWDDGPGFDAASVVADADGLNLSIMRGLVAQLGGSLRVECNGGTTMMIEFPQAVLSD